ncbi:MAG: hypothetical protein WB699_14345, partial [Bacteroidota bacterium]
TGDWTYAMATLDSGMPGKLILVLAALAAYYFSIRIVRTQAVKCTSYLAGVSLRESVCYAYCAGALAAFVAGLFFHPRPIQAAVGGLFEMIASLPIVFVVTKNMSATEVVGMNRSWAFNGSIVILFLLFCLTLGRGFVF